MQCGMVWVAGALWWGDGVLVLVAHCGALWCWCWRRIVGPVMGCKGLCSGMGVFRICGRLGVRVRVWVARTLW